MPNCINPKSTNYKKLSRINVDNQTFEGENRQGVLYIKGQVRFTLARYCTGNS